MKGLWVEGGRRRGGLRWRIEEVLGKARAVGRCWFPFVKTKRDLDVAETNCTTE